MPRAEVANRPRDALDHGVDVEGVFVPGRRLQSFEGGSEDRVAEHQQLEAGGRVAPATDARHETRPRQGADHRGHGLLVAGLHVEQPGRRLGAVAVAGEAVPAGEQRGAHGGERPLAGAAQKEAAARVGGREAGAVEADGAGRGRLGEDHPGEDLGVLLGQRAGQRRRRRGAGDGIGEDLHDHAQTRRLDDAFADSRAQMQWTDWGEPHIESMGVRRPLAGSRVGDGGRHFCEIACLPGKVEAGAAHVLVGLGVDRQIRVQRMQFGGHVARRNQAVDAVGVAAVVHDPRRQHLVAERGPAGLAAARVGHVGGLAHVVHVHAPGRGAHGDVLPRIAGQEREFGGARREGRGDDGRRHQDPALRAACAPGGREQLRGARRVDAHADARQQFQRSAADGFDGLGRPEVGDAGVCGRGVHHHDEPIRAASGVRRAGRHQDMLRTLATRHRAMDSPTPEARTQHDKGLKSGALGMASTVVIGVAAPAPDGPEAQTQCLFSAASSPGSAPRRR